jgi:hypothetical protein
MIHWFRRRAGAIFTSCPRNEQAGEWLAMMRHYGLPTRLLDWTESILIAAYFAVAYRQQPGDAAIWTLSPIRLNHVCAGERLTLCDLTNHPLVDQAIHRGVREGTKLPLPKVAAGFVMEFEPRMRVQQAAFTIHGPGKPLEELPECVQCLTKLIIPAASKDNLNKAVRLLGVNVGTVFPDLEHLAANARQEIMDIHKGGHDQRET